MTKANSSSLLCTKRLRNTAGQAEWVSEWVSVSRTQWLEMIWNKVPIHSCPRHGLPPDENPSLRLLPSLPVWPVIPDCLDNSQSTIPSPRPTHCLKFNRSISTQHCTATLPGYKTPEKDRTMPRISLFIPLTKSFFFLLRKARLNSRVSSNRREGWF